MGEEGEEELLSDGGASEMKKYQHSSTNKDKCINVRAPFTRDVSAR